MEFIFLAPEQLRLPWLLPLYAVFVYLHWGEKERAGEREGGSGEKEKIVARFLSLPPTNCL